MEAKKQSEIARKYWKGESSAAEEKALLKSDWIGLSEEEKTHFEQIKQFSELTLDADFEENILKEIQPQSAIIRPLIPSLVWKVAAIFVLGLSFYWMYQPMPPMEESTEIAAIEDPKEAYEVTKQALLLISEKLNKANNVELGLDKFEDARKKIQEGS